MNDSHHLTHNVMGKIFGIKSITTPYFGKLIKRTKCLLGGERSILIWCVHRFYFFTISQIIRAKIRLAIVCCAFLSYLVPQGLEATP